MNTSEQIQTTGCDKIASFQRIISRLSYFPENKQENDEESVSPVYCCEEWLNYFGLVSQLIVSDSTKLKSTLKGDPSGTVSYICRLDFKKS